MCSIIPKILQAYLDTSVCVPLFHSVSGVLSFRKLGITRHSSEFTLYIWMNAWKYSNQSNLILKGTLEVSELRSSEHMHMCRSS